MPYSCYYEGKRRKELTGGENALLCLELSMENSSRAVSRPPQSFLLDEPKHPSCSCICRHYLSAVIVLLLGGTKQTPCSSPRAGDEDLPLTASVRCPQSALAGFCSLLYDAVLSFLSHWVSSDDVSDLIVIC